MATTNSTPNYELSQYVGSDVTSYLTNYNSDMTKIDAQMKRNADSAATANDNATIAVSTATTAASDASTALSTANTASSTAGAAQITAEAAQTAAGAAQTDAANALRASAANSIENLAPAYDPTLTYNVGDLVTYVDENNSGKLYKCIVAIGTPEAFNVNKWDDVTTSEAFEKNKELVASHITSASDTWKEAFDALISQFTPDVSKTYSLIVESNSFSEHNINRTVYNNGNIEFSTVGISSNGSFSLQRKFLSPNASQSLSTAFNTSGTMTITDNSNTAIGSVLTLKIFTI